MTRQKSHAFDSEKVGRYMLFHVCFPTTRQNGVENRDKACLESSVSHF